jgi:alpha-glucosidase
VFNWNRDKFPDPAGFVRHYLDHSVKLCANIKPCLLQDHPRFAEAEADGLFVHEADGTPTAVQFWDETGAYLDFTNPATLAWWKERVRTDLLDYGVAATWNDNNEFEIWSNKALADGFGSPYPAREAKPLQTLLMIRASRAAQQEAAPQQRPFLISRSGAAGMQRYVQTWSGDNYTSWETLRYNIKMALGLALSGVSNTGHDIGGFSGPAPDPELFLRWVQHGIFLPRFSIHSWNDDASVNEPWMYPSLRASIRDLIRLRYSLVPYFYDLLWRSHDRYEPIIRPTLYDFPDDERCFEENDDMMLGANLLVASIVEPGHQSRRVYLPAGVNWCDFWSGEHHAGGQEIELGTAPTRPPLLAREGCALPVNLALQHFARPAEQRGFIIFPHAGDGEFSASFFEDDGESHAYREGHCGHWTLRVVSDSATLDIIAGAGGEVPHRGDWLLRLPARETRTARINGTLPATDALTDGWRCLSLPR